MEVGRGGTKGVGGRSSLPGVEDDGMSGGIEALLKQVREVEYAS